MQSASYTSHLIQVLKLGGFGIPVFINEGTKIQGFFLFACFFCFLFFFWFSRLSFFFLFWRRKTIQCFTQISGT